MYQRLFAIFAIWFLLGASLLSGVGDDLAVNASGEVCAPANLRRISLTVQDKEGRFVDNLSAADFTISENKTPREILTLERRMSEPLSVAIMIDTSASQERTLGSSKLAARKFVESILRSGMDRIALVSFTGEATVEKDLTDDLTRLQAAIDRVEVALPPGYLLGGVVLGPRPPSSKTVLLGSTAIWDAIQTTVDRILPAGKSRQVIVLITDGEDTISKLKLRDAIELAVANDIAVFSIGIAGYGGLNRDNLKRLSEETGGQAFFPKNVSHLDAIFSETARALQSRYVLSYCAATQPPAAKLLKIEIKVTNPQLRQLNPRTSYARYARGE